jgi:hypothetical protein
MDGIEPPLGDFSAADHGFAQVFLRPTSQRSRVDDDFARALQNCLDFL